MGSGLPLHLEAVPFFWANSLKSETLGTTEKCVYRDLCRVYKLAPRRWRLRPTWECPVLGGTWGQGDVGRAMTNNGEGVPPALVWNVPFWCTILGCSPETCVQGPETD